MASLKLSIIGKYKGATVLAQLISNYSLGGQRCRPLIALKPQLTSIIATLTLTIKQLFTEAQLHGSSSKIR